MQYHILIVDDDSKILKLLKDFFVKNDFLVSTAADIESAQLLLQTSAFDLIILDVMLPNITGIEFAKQIRDMGSTMPIVMLTALFSAQDRIGGLEAGANDYLTKPFEPRELLLRVLNLIKADKKNQLSAAGHIQYFGNNYYNLRTKEFFKQHKVVKLSSTEQKLLEILITNSNQIVSRQSIIDKLGVISLRSIDVRIVRLRCKIENNPKNPKYLKTVRHEGYALYF